MQLPRKGSGKDFARGAVTKSGVAMLLPQSLDASQTARSAKVAVTP